MPKASIIIPVFNKVEFTKKCIESIFQNSHKNTFEVIVVNNASSDGTNQYLESMKYRLVIISNEENLGFAKACNQGAEKSKGDYLIFLNNDTEILPGWMDVLIDELDSQKNVAIAGSKLLFPDNSIQHAGVVIADDKTPFHIYSREKSEKSYVNKKRYFKAVTAASMIVRKDIFFQAGRFSEEYLNGYEDIDLCLKVGELGKLISYCPESVAYHFESMSPGRMDKHSENKSLFLRNWKDKIDSDYRDFMFKDGTLSQLESYKERCKELEKRLQNKEEEFEKIVNSLRWKIPNFIYKIYRKKIKRFIPKSLFRIRKISLVRIANKWLQLSILAWNEYKIGGIKKLIFAIRRHLKKRTGQLLVGYPTIDDFRKNVVSIGILTIDHLELIEPCLESIEGNLSDKYAIEILIGDTGSKKRETWKFYRKIKKRYSNIKIINFKKYFFSRNYNDLFEMYANGEYLIFLNNDTLVKRGWIDSLIDPLKDKKIGIVGGKLLYKNSTIQHAGIEVNEEGHFFHKYSKEKSDLPDANFPALVPAVTFACVAMRHDVFNRFKLSEDFREESQDTDLCLRLKEAGFDVLYEPRCEIYHLECSTRDWKKGSVDHTNFHEKYASRIKNIIENKQRIPFDPDRYNDAIVVIRDDGIGDLLMGISAFKSLREKNRGSKIILFTYERNVEMMAGFEIFDEILPIPNQKKYSPLPIPSNAKKIFRLIDLEMDFNNSFAKSKSDNKINRHLVMSRLLEVDAPYELVKMPDYPEAKRNVLEILKGMGIDPGQEFVVLNLIASNPARSWWEPYYPKLIKAIEDLGFIPLVVGTKESPYFQGDKMVNLVGKTKTIAEYIEAVKLGKYVVSTDTSAYHVAALAGIPFLAIFTGGVLPEARLSNYSKYEVIEPQGLSCYPCWDEGCKDLSIRHKKEPCRIKITPEKVIGRLRLLIEKHP